MKRATRPPNRDATHLIATHYPNRDAKVGNATRHATSLQTPYAPPATIPGSGSGRGKPPIPRREGSAPRRPSMRNSPAACTHAVCGALNRDAARLNTTQCSASRLCVTTRHAASLPPPRNGRIGFRPPYPKKKPRQKARRESTFYRGLPLFRR